MKLKIPHSHLKLNSDAIYFCWYNHKLVSIPQNTHQWRVQTHNITKHLHVSRGTPGANAGIVSCLDPNIRRKTGGLDFFLQKIHMIIFQWNTTKNKKKRKKKKQGKKKETLHETIEQNFKKTKSSVVVVIY